MFKINIGLTGDDFWHKNGPTKLRVSIYLEPLSSTVLVLDTSIRFRDEDDPLCLQFMQKMNCNTEKFAFLLAPAWFIHQRPILAESQINMYMSIFKSEKVSSILGTILRCRQELIEKHEKELS